jgi:hypothetical protein
MIPSVRGADGHVRQFEGEMDSRGLGGPRPGLLGFMAREQVQKEQETTQEPLCKGECISTP